MSTPYDTYAVLDQDYDEVEAEAELRADIQRQFALGIEVHKAALLEHRLVNALLGRRTR
jgi:hypothetical protein